MSSRGYFPNSPSQTAFLHSNHGLNSNPGSPQPLGRHQSEGSLSVNSSVSDFHSNSSHSPVYTNSHFSRTNSRGSAGGLGSGSGISYMSRSGRQVPSVVPSISDKFSLSADPHVWGSTISPNVTEPDDALHNVNPRRDRMNDRGTIFTVRGLLNLGCIFLLCIGLVTLFAGYPVISYFTRTPLSTLGGFNLGGINSTGQVPDMPGHRGLIDVETPADAMTWTSYKDGEEWELVFSDEFNTNDRTFYPGDDPYWEAVDLHYWQTGNLEWYDPAAITTKNGSLEITLSEMNTHNLSYQGGMMSSWNKFCFTGGLILSSVTLPGAPDKHGLWPAVWTMGNLGRAGYGASLEGMWPYTYDSCDVGTVANQSVNGIPVAATENGDSFNYDLFSMLPGQRLSRCTCPGESHPGPMHSNGDYVGRSAPEIDIFEATVSGSTGVVSQSGQWAPFDAGYHWNNDSASQIIVDSTITKHNSYEGGAYQMATSALSVTNQDCYELGTGCFSVYGFEYKPGYDSAYISWINDGKLAWTMMQSAVGPDTAVEISDRPVPQEPMYIIANLGMSTAFGGLDTSILTFPTTMRIDWIRVYQPKGQKNIGCDPPDFPTQAYINQYIDAYTNPNFTTWQGLPVDGGYQQPWPKNRFLGQC